MHAKAYLAYAQVIFRNAHPRLRLERRLIRPKDGYGLWWAHLSSEIISAKLPAGGDHWFMVYQVEARNICCEIVPLRSIALGARFYVGWRSWVRRASTHFEGQGLWRRWKDRMKYSAWQNHGEVDPWSYDVASRGLVLCTLEFFWTN